MNDLIERLRAMAGSDMVPMEKAMNLLLEAANAIEASQMGLRYAVQVWVLADELEWSEAEIDEAVERVIGYAKKKARNG
nr:MAG TPA_asm: hypothetical protein [Caudoviricetes sp.]